MINIPSEVKMLLQKDGVRKNFRIHFPNGEREDIINTHLVQGSVSLTESLCSRDKLKFGLCEAACLEFKTMNVENIKGMTIETQMEIDVSSCILENGECNFEYEQREDLSYPTYPISYGKFIVQSCEREGSNLQRRKVEAYSPEHEFKIGNEEKRKQMTLVEKESFYEVDTFKFLASNINFLEKEKLELSETKMEDISYRTNKERCKNSDYFIRFMMSERRLYFANSNLDASVIGTWYSTKYTELFYVEFSREEKAISELTAWIEKYGGNLKEWMTCPYFRAGHFPMAAGGTCVTRNIFYPMISSFYTGEYVMNFYMPKTLTVYIYADADSEEPIDKKTVTICNSPKLYQINLENSDYINGIPFKISRSKSYTGYKVHPVQEDIREIFEAYLELNGLFGQIDRKTNQFETISLTDRGGLVPSEMLTPSETLIPSGGVSQLITRKMHRQCWYDDEPTLPYGKVSVTYTSANDKIVTTELFLNGLDEETYNDTQYQTYDLSENYIVQNNTFEEDTINEILQKVGVSIANVQYMPAEISMNYGLPYLEIGDYVTVMLSNAETFNTLVLRRTLSGIQALKDNYESKG